MKKRYKKAIETWFNNVQLDITLYSYENWSCEKYEIKRYEINLINNKKIFIGEYFYSDKNFYIDMCWMDNNEEIFSSIYAYMISKIKLTKVEEILASKIKEEIN